MSNQDKFRFFVPIELQKGKDGQIKEIIVDGKASSPDLDSQEEMLDPNGADLSSFLLINDNHIKGAPGILGEIIESQARKDGIYLKGRLYPELENVQKLVQLEQAIKKNNGKLRLAMSIEGRAIERDPLDKRRITRSKLHGVALTYQPINGNTWANLIAKGASYQGDDELQYQSIIESKDPDVVKASNGGDEKLILDIKDEDGNRITVSKNFEIKIDKAMSTGNSGAIMPESLEGGIANTTSKQKKSKKSFFIQNKSDKFNTKLAKSEVYDYIFDNIPDISLSSAKQLYTTIGTLQKLNNQSMSELTAEKIEKAFQVIGTLSDQADSIEKGFPTKTQGDQHSTLSGMVTLIKGCMEQKMEKADIFKAVKEKDEYKDAKDEDVEKAYQSCLQKSDDNDEDDEDEKDEKGEDEKEMEKMKKGDKMKKSEDTPSIDDEIVKAEKALEDLKAQKQQQLEKSQSSDDIKKSEDTGSGKVEELLKGMQDHFDQKFAAIGEINKALLDQNDELKDKLFKSEKENKELGEKSQGRKSILTQSFIEKGEQNGLTKQSALSVSQHKAQILAKSDEIIDWQSDSIKKGEGDEFRFANDIATFESTGQVSALMVNKFKEKGIVLAK